MNLVQALADEWSESGVHVNAVNPERTRTPMRRTAFGDEPVQTLLDPAVVASTVVDLLASRTTGHVIDIRLSQPEVEHSTAEQTPPNPDPDPPEGRPASNGRHRDAAKDLAAKRRGEHRKRPTPHGGL